MPRERIYADNAEKQAAYNERKRQIRLEAERKEKAELTRVAQLQASCRRAVGRMLTEMPGFGLDVLLHESDCTAEDAAEAEAYIRRIGDALKAGKTWIA